MTPPPVPLEAMRKRILDLEIFSRGLDTHAMLRKLQELVPTFKPADLHGLPPTPTPNPEQSRAPDMALEFMEQKRPRSVAAAESLGT